MDAGPTASIPITRPHLPPMERFSEVVADLFASRLLSNFAKYTGLLESRAAAVLDHPAPLCVSSCDIGLTLAWRALECSAGEVIVPSAPSSLDFGVAEAESSANRCPKSDSEPQILALRSH
jgi:dTDP-4-amino-4,6-dideoxygalactose transaminase